jgi:hypothetical protein
MGMVFFCTVLQPLSEQVVCTRRSNIACKPVNTYLVFAPPMHKPSCIYHDREISCKGPRLCESKANEWTQNFKPNE